MTFISEDNKRAIRNKLDQKYEKANQIIESSRVRYAEYNVDHSNKYIETVLLAILFIGMLAALPFILRITCENFDSRFMQVSALTAYISIVIHILSIAANNISNMMKSEILFSFIAKVNNLKDRIRSKINGIDTASKNLQNEISQHHLIVPQKNDDIDKEIDTLRNEMLSLDFGNDLCERFRDVMYYLSAIIVNFAAVVIVGSFVADSLYDVIGIHNAVTILIFGILTFVTMFISGSSVNNRTARYILMLISFIAPILISIVISVAFIASMAIPILVVICMVIAGLAALFN